ncbi:MAG: hypothetical protein JKY18_00970 [Flavobacteriales bacterium]|nr:hypothetical protein [Flavobacteriales bacterium]
MKHSVVATLILVFIVAALTILPITDLIAAGPPGPPGGGGDPPCWPAPCVPIDGGIGFLIAAGLLYGGKKAYRLLEEKG